MLVARPVSHWWSVDYRIFDGAEQCALLRGDSGGRFLIEIGDEQYEGSSKVPNEEFDAYGKLAVTLIDLKRLRVASAYWVRSRYNVPFKGRVHAVEFTQTNFFASSYPFFTDREQAGTLALKKWFREEWHIDVPDELPLYLRVFMLQLVFRLLPQGS